MGFSRIKINTILFLFLIPVIILSNYRQLKFDNITISDGLSQNEVRTLYQDSKGFMWFGTADGLNRYDGYKIKQYKYSPLDSNSISDNFIWAITECDSGNLWVGTSGGGLNKFIREKNKFVTYKNNPSDSNSLPSNNIIAIEKGENGTLWLGTDGGGLCHFDPGSENFRIYQHSQDKNSINSNSVKTLHKTDSGQLWIGTNKGLNVMDIETGRIQSYKFDNPEEEELKSNPVNSIFQDKSGCIWIGTENGLSRYVPGSGDDDFIEFPLYKNSTNSAGITTILEDKKGYLLVGSELGLFIIDPERKEVIAYHEDDSNPWSLSSDYILDIYESNDGVVWIGTINGGVCKYSRLKYDFYHFRPTRYAGKAVRTIHIDENKRIWIGTSEKGVSIFSPKDDKFYTIAELYDIPFNIETTEITDICEDSLANIWIATWNAGLLRYNKNTNKWEKYTHKPWDKFSLSNNRIQTLFVDSENNLWLGTYNGGSLIRFDYNEEKFIHYEHDPADSTSLSGPTIQPGAIIEDENGKLWIGTWHGLNQFDPVNGKFKQFLYEPNNFETLSSNHVTAIVQGNNKDILWIGTSAGLNKFNKQTQKVENYYLEKDGLPNNFIYCILKDEAGNIWMSTNNGLAKFDPETESIISYNEGNGLQSNQFLWGAAEKGDDGDLYFGGINGFNRFNPEDVVENPIKPSIYITDIKSFNRSLDFKKDIASLKKIVLPYDKNRLTFEFVALNYTLPGKNRYSYKLVGLDKDWSRPARHRAAKYTNIDPGKYTFKVKGANNDGVWSANNAQIQIIITPPFWKTWWFRILTVLAILTGFAIWYWRHVHNIYVRKQELENEVQIRTRELRSKNQELKKALREIDKLGGLLPICSHCKKIRDDAGYWQEVEQYIYERSDTKFTHGICPECIEKHYPEFVKRKKEKEKK